MTTPIRRRQNIRNRADRITHGLTESQATNLIMATLHAARIGMPLNRMITIHWGATGLLPSQTVEATGHFIDLMRKALAYHGAPFTAVWVQEAGEGKGHHVHILAHINPAMAGMIFGKQRGWVSRVAQRPYTARSIRSRWIVGYATRCHQLSDLYWANAEQALRYLLKGCLPEAADKLVLRRRPEGRCYGKRCGVSENVGMAARRRKPTEPGQEVGFFGNLFGNERIVANKMLF